MNRAGTKAVIYFPFSSHRSRTSLPSTIGLQLPFQSLQLSRSPCCRCCVAGSISALFASTHPPSTRRSALVAGKLPKSKLLRSLRRQLSLQEISTKHCSRSVTPYYFRRSLFVRPRLDNLVHVGLSTNVAKNRTMQMTANVYFSRRGMSGP
ncbi:MAG: hypothetical protein H6Q76_1508 [Firmicutes bacterium]|nr:hypothetical protein [Bacillota bacterium]